MISEETRRRLVESHLGKRQTEATKKKISLNSWFRGHPERNPFYGKRLPEKHRHNISKALKGKVNSGQFKKGMTSWLKGTKGIVKPNSGSFKKGHKTKVTPELIKKRLHRREMSSLELEMQNIITNNGLPYRFVGNGDFLIENKNPDFININGEKIAIEVYYRRHKKMFRGSVSRWKRERTRIFKKYGWKVIFFDETEVNEPFVLARLQDDTP